MALRTPKITSEVLHTCNKLFSTKPDILLKASTQLANSSNTETPRTVSSFRYTIKNTEKPRSLPQIRFGDDKEFTNFSDLQPSAEPLFNFEYQQSKWSDSIKNDSPFPSNIKPNSSGIVYSDLQKAEDKLLKSKIDTSLAQYRNFSTMSVRHYGRAPADNNSEAHCAKKISKCVKVNKPSRQCKMNKNCPRFKISDCKQSKGSDCRLNYLDPNCTKKYAPYPSYSESCAENLPDDPSECQQCPWRTCDGADTIEPGKPVRGRRHYSTSAALQRNVNGVVTRLPQPLPEEILKELMCGRKCGVTKKPCKEPPGPCEVRRKNEEARHDKDKHGHDHQGHNKHGHNKHGHDKKKKAMDFENGMVLGKFSSNVPHIINPYTMESVRLDLDGSNIYQTGSWIDLDKNKFQNDLWACEKKNKYPHCHKKKKPKRPKQNAVDDIQLAAVSMSEKKGRYDEGHPPPCDSSVQNSKRCPKEKLKKPKYKKRPMTGSYYRRPEDPYNKES
ncbi:hypothetical protein GWI33_020181 [Rhynchophorus ferrugineus]|uniref:Uncharacterized protein n=1 Tax=Rhynchophorus ferrugineus TaxID=354439 RepID=A0A834HR32_RHYFE|nr:hypothetical protein GWI33_020181 [Rhynchophorus ferrugineus]